MTELYLGVTILVLCPPPPLFKIVDRILKATDRNSRGETIAVLLTMVDWKEAYDRQCPKLGVEAFLNCGVRPSLIPV